MAAGVITIGHDSGGPRTDIIREYEGHATGFRATTPIEYADALEIIFNEIDNVKKTNKFDPYNMVVTARKSVSRFSDDVFAQEFLLVLQDMIQENIENVQLRNKYSNTSATIETRNKTKTRKSTALLQEKKRH